MISADELAAALAAMDEGDYGRFGGPVSSEVMQHHIAVRTAEFGIDDETRAAIAAWVAANMATWRTALEQAGRDCCVVHVVGAVAVPLFEDGFRAAIALLRARGVDVGEL